MWVLIAAEGRVRACRRGGGGRGGHSSRRVRRSTGTLNNISRDPKVSAAFHRRNRSEHRIRAWLKTPPLLLMLLHYLLETGPLSGCLFVYPLF